jgi:hypothetical protein
VTYQRSARQRLDKRPAISARNKGTTGLCNTLLGNCSVNTLLCLCDVAATIRLHFLKEERRNELADVKLQAALRLSAEERQVRTSTFSKLLLIKVIAYLSYFTLNCKITRVFFTGSVLRVKSYTVKPALNGPFIKRKPVLDGNIFRSLD